jgi:hypothetical protein
MAIAIVQSLQPVQRSSITTLASVVGAIVIASSGHTAMHQASAHWKQVYGV